ncbi:MAG: bifunctional riboflavin kinase/FAD synthetase [Candidatus Omnitrophota bacterium]
MEVISGLNRFKKNEYKGPAAVAIGTFDGVHLAHQAIIKKAVKVAKKYKGHSVVLTFFPHPLKVTNPYFTPALLTSLDHRVKLIEELNPDICLVVNFMKRFSGFSPEEFCAKVLKGKLDSAFVIVGEKFNFGKDRLGNVSLLKKYGKQLGFRVEILKALKKKKQIVSSSLIRIAVENGDLKKAEAMLGRPFSVLGTVEKGDQRGRDLGFATANIDSHQEAVPSDGVYAVTAKLNKKYYKGMLNIGTRPTFKDKLSRHVIELHIFSFNQDIYSQNIEVFFVKKFRQERRFASVDLLKKQLHKDKKKALEILT